MKKTAIFLVLFVLLFGVSGALEASITTGQGTATTILLCSDSLHIFKGDVAITSFTETWYEDGQLLLTVDISNIQYERIPTGNGYFTYRVSGFDAQNPDQPPSEPVTNDDGAV